MNSASWVLAISENFEVAARRARGRVLIYLLSDDNFTAFPAQRAAAVRAAA